MDGNLNMTMDQLKKEQPVIKEQETTREHLTQLQNWDVAEGQTLEERRAMKANELIQQNKEMNLALKTQVKKELPPVQAQQAAAGVPVQVQVPADQTWKEKRAEKKRIKEAKDKQPLADAVSAHMMQSLRTSSSCQNNSLAMRPKGTDVDVRVLRSFVKGYRKKWTGSPATEQDEKNKEEDRKFIDDYCSKDLERRKPHLERIVNELINETFNEDLLTVEYLEHHAGEVKNKISRGIYFENIYKDPINKPYFDSLPQLKKDLIQHRIFDNYANFGMLFTSRCNMKGVDSDKVMYNNSLTERHQRDFADTAEQMTAITREGRARAKEAEKEAVQREVKKRMDKKKEELMGHARMLKADAEKTAAQFDRAGLNLTSYVTNYSFDTLRDARKMIEDHPKEYKANKQIVDRLYHELYQAVDAFGDLNMNSMAAQKIIDDIREPLDYKWDKAHVAERLIVDDLVVIQENGQTESAEVFNQIMSYQDALLALLRGKEFTESAKFVLRRFGYQI